MAITVSALSLTPVKGTRIHEVDAIEIGRTGALGDRAFYVIDERGAMVNGKSVAALQAVVADYLPEEETLALRLPDGSRVEGRVRLGTSVTTSFFGAPRPARTVDGPWSVALSRALGERLRLVRGEPAVDRGPEGAVSIVSRGSLRRLAEADAEIGAARIDPRRFRMLIEIDGVGAHEEDGWVGRELTAGGARLRVAGHVGRCATTTRSPDTGRVDYPTLKLLATYRRDEPTSEPLAFGVHGEVVAPGSVRVGDAVRLGGRADVAAAGGR